jgi:streptogramin lyase
MGTSRQSWSANRVVRLGWRAAVVGIAALGLVAGYSAFGNDGGAVAAQGKPTAVSQQAMGSVSGTVTASKPFKAAQVYLRNVDKRIQYMVYTNAGAFRAVALFPGNYELTVRARGLESETQKLVVKTGEQPGLKVTLKDAKRPDQYPSSVDPATVTEGNGAGYTGSVPVTLASYDEIYPPGPGKQVIENLCMNCHGENTFPMQPKSAAGWKLGLDYMMGKTLIERDKERFGEGTLGGSASNFAFGLQDRKEVLAYLQKNFGLDKKPRAVRSDKEIPLDEARLGKAEFIEYYLPGDDKAAEKPGDASSKVAASDSESNASGKAGLQIAITLQLDAQGNVWTVDRGVPSRLVKLDPRTGEQKAWSLPDPKAGVHEILIDRKGMVWVPEFSRNADGSGDEIAPKLLGFNPKTEKWEFQLDADPDNVIRSTHKGPLMGSSLDSKGNIYMNWMLTGAIAKWDPTAKKMSVFRIPTPNAIPYGQTIDGNDNVWVAEWNGGKLGKFDTKVNQWSEFIPPTYPANFRRGPGADSANNIWVGIWAAGNRPAKIAKLDQKTGTWTEWPIPHRASQPYEATADREDNIWFPDTGTPDTPASIGRFNPRDQTFTFYPKPQFIADTSKLQHTADGAVWYAPRYGAVAGSSGFGVLFPDMDKITTLAPLALNGVPGYAFKGSSAAPSSK